ncbi:MAG: hypothetical protein D6775_16745 [Caldilineae bacterium]|nr:MAG: hypothetical protein D6775_16745 [Caldilineae bacterium]
MESSDGQKWPCDHAGHRARRRRARWLSPRDSMDPRLQQDLQNRLRCVEGHVRGVALMIGQNRPVQDIVLQMEAIEGSLRAVRRLLLQTELETLLAGLNQPTEEERKALHATLVALLDFSQRSD